MKDEQERKGLSGSWDLVVGGFVTERAQRWKELQGPFFWGPKNYEMRLESQEGPDCAEGLDQDFGLHSMGTGQWWGMGDVIKFAIYKGVALGYLGWREVQCLRGAQRCFWSC